MHRLRLWRVQATGSTALGHAFFSGVHPAADGALLAECLRNDEGVAALVMWPDGSTATIRHDWLGTDPLDAWAIVPVGHTLVFVRGDEHRPQGIPWSEVARLRAPRAQ